MCIRDSSWTATPAVSGQPRRPPTQTSAAAGSAVPSACSGPSSTRPSRQRSPADRASTSPWVGPSGCPA
eukprot:13015305-Alexandrium_andersonii.AAC.1